MKNFLVFIGSHYYPDGGWEDFKQSFDSEEEALSYISNQDGDWWQIVDVQSGKIVKYGHRL